MGGQKIKEVEFNGDEKDLRGPKIKGVKFEGGGQ